MGKEKHKKDKEKSKSKQEKKDKKHKKHKRRSSSDSSDSDESFEGAEQQLQRERAAVNTLRDILSTYPAVRKELREILWRVDQGEAANISGVPDPELKSQLARLLELLRLRRNDKGVYGLINRNERILPVIGFVFDEPPRPRFTPAAAAPPPPPVAAAAAPAPAPAAASSPARPTAAGQLAGSQEPRSPRAAADEGTEAGGPYVTTRRVGAMGPIGPQPPLSTSGDGVGPDVGGAVKMETEEGEEAGARQEVKKEEEVGEGAAAATAPVRRVAGPAMPPRELLEAAAAAAEALQAAGPPGAAGLSYGDSDDDGLLVGPPPPEMVEELEAAPQDAREAEVVRIIKVLRETSTDTAPGPGPAPPPGATAADRVDAYEVLCVTPATTGAEVKKRYMRLSLLIHPDKCSHPLAHEAFQAVATAARVLQDSGLRAALNERREDRELRKRAEAAAAQQERERAWRVARGEEVAGAGPVGLSGPQRETWMTELPPEMSTCVGGGQMSQTSVRAFSQRGKTGRGDTSAWTDNPEQRKAKEAQALLAAASDAYVRALPAAGTAGQGGSGGAAGVGTAAAAALDSFNSASRKKSLMEVHLEMQEKAHKEVKAAKKAAKKQRTAEAAQGKEGAAAGQDWPWRPFDRDRDLDLKPKAKTGSEIVKSAAALGSKFSGGGTQRHFL